MVFNLYNVHSYAMYKHKIISWWCCTYSVYNVFEQFLLRLLYLYAGKEQLTDYLQNSFRRNKLAFHITDYQYESISIAGILW